MVFYGVSGIVILAAVLFLAVVLLVLPLQLAAKAMGARRYGTGWCLVSLLAAAGMQMVGLSVPAYGTLAAFLWSLYALFFGTAGTPGMVHPFAFTLAPSDGAANINEQSTILDEHAPAVAIHRALAVEIS